MIASTASSASLPLLVLGACAMRQAMAADIPVPDTGDINGNGTALVAAVTAANATPEADVILLDPGVHYVLTAPSVTDGSFGSTALPRILTDVTIRGGFSSPTTPTVIRRDGKAPEFRLFFVSWNGSLRLESLQVSGGRIAFAGIPLGGGIINAGGNLELFQAEISGNAATIGGGIANRNDLDFRGNVTIEESTVRNNSATNSAGGIHNAGQLTLARSTLAGNTGDEFGGAIVSSGNAARLEMTNSTVSGNRNAGVRPSGSAGLLIGGGRATIVFSTIANNAGLGIRAEPKTVVTLHSTILAGNREYVGGDVPGDCVGDIQSGNYNLIGIAGTTSNCNFHVRSDDRAGIRAAALDAKLGGLLDNGGFTLTHSLLDGSPAIRAGASSRGRCPATDQRGEIRPRWPDPCDIGAFQAPADLCATNPLLCISYEASMSICIRHPDYCRIEIIPRIWDALPKFPQFDPKILDCLLDGPGCGPLPPLD